MAGLGGFHWLDYVMCVLLLLLSSCIGVYYAVVDSKTQTKEEYLHGGRRMRWFPLALSLLVSFNSGMSQLGKPAEVYLYGMQYIVSNIGIALAVVISVVTYVPLLYKLKLTSSYEYLEVRFQSRAVRKVGSLLVMTYELIYMSVSTYSPAVALETVTGFPMWASIICVGVIATFYTTLGGIKAVVWTDAFQFVSMTGGVLAVVICGIYQVGGLEQMWSINKSSGRLDIFNFSADPTVRMSFWSLLFGRLGAFLQSYCVCQSSVQRFSSIPTLTKAKLMILANLPLQLFFDLLFCSAGLVIFSYFSHCDPLKHPDPEHRLSSPNQLLPLFVMSVMNWPGVPGIFMAGIFSGSLSTVSSSMSSLATLTWEDFLKWRFSHFSEKKVTFILKIIVVVYGIAGFSGAFLVSTLQGSIMQVGMSFTNTAISPVLGLFILGAFFTRANWLGGMIGSIAGFALSMWIAIGAYTIPSTPSLNTTTAGCDWNRTFISNATVTTNVDPIEGVSKLYTVSFLYYPVIGTLTTVLVGLICSLLLASYISVVRPEDIVDEYLIFPLDRWPQKKNKSDERKIQESQHLNPRVSDATKDTLL